MPIPKTVWILGAGFSRSLGGPLLNDLYSFATRAWLQFGRPEEWPGEYDLVWGLYHYGAGLPEGYLFEPGYSAIRGHRLWANPEEFLERLSMSDGGPAGPASPWAAFFRQLVAEMRAKGGPTDLTKALETIPQDALGRRYLARLARKTLALQCNRFDLAVRGLERARPYVAWGSRLHANDTIVSFNYDLAVEIAGYCGVGGDLRTGAGRVVVFLPQDIPALSTSATLLKLHGSVDWQMRDGTVASQCGQMATDPLIAAPGVAKLALKDGGLKPLWDLAGERIRGAEKIVWLGYSMPASDASAVETLLSAVSENESPDLTIDVVLGGPSFERERLRGLLDYALGLRGRGGRCEVREMFAQDYLVLSAKERERATAGP